MKHLLFDEFRLLLGRFGVMAVIFLCPLQSTLIHSQNDAQLSYDHNLYEKGVRLYRQNLYSSAYLMLDNYLSEITRNSIQSCPYCIKNARVVMAECALYMQAEAAEVILEDIIQQYQPDPLVQRLLLNAGRFYHSRQNHNEVIRYLSQADSRVYNEEDGAHFNYMLGIAHYEKGDYKAARSYFEDAYTAYTKYYYPSLYYHAFCSYSLGDETEALESFEKLQNSEQYRNQVPILIAKIYHSRAAHREVIAYLEPQIDEPYFNQIDSLHLLLGEAYFHEKNYEKAESHLLAFASNHKNLESTHNFLIAESLFLNGKHTQALPFYQNVKEPDKLFQHAYYQIGTIYLENAQHEKARSAFYQAMLVEEGDPRLRAEALFLYGKLSVSERYPEEAIKALRSIEKWDPNYGEAQTLLALVFSQSTNYSESMRILEPLKHGNPTLGEAYQKVSLYKGIERINSNDLENAVKYLTLSLDNPINDTLKSQTIFWLADVFQRMGQVEKSQKLYHEFLLSAPNYSNLPEETSVITAYYAQGYNYMHSGYYEKAQEYFSKTIQQIQDRRYSLTTDYVKSTVLSDAYIRLADCHFKRNNYYEALRNYNLAIDNKYGDVVYSMYHKAMIHGLLGQPLEKVITLEKIFTNHEQHQLADDAIFQTGVTYQEENNYKQAREAFQKLTKEYASKSNYVNPSLLRLGLIAYNQGDIYAALDYYKEVFSNNPTKEVEAEAMLAIKEIYIQDLNDPDGLFNFLNELPGFTIDNRGRDSISYQAALVPYHNGDTKKSIEGFQSYLEKYPNGKYTLSARFNKADALIQESRYEEAFSEYERIVSSGYSQYYMSSCKNAAIISHEHLKKFDLALMYYELLEQASADVETEKVAVLGIMRTAYALGKNEEMTEACNKVISGHRFDQSEIAEANFYLGKHAYDNRKFEAAVSNFNEVARITNNHFAAESKYIVAKIYYMNNEFGLAQKLCSNAIRESGSYPYWVAKCLLLNADIHISLDNLIEARASLEAIKENYQINDDGISEETLAKIKMVENLEK